MGKSRKKTPIYGIAVHKTSDQTKFRKGWNRALRRRMKQVETPEEGISLRKIYGNEWLSPRDGKSYTKKPHDGSTKRERDWYKEVFRK